MFEPGNRYTLRKSERNRKMQMQFDYLELKKGPDKEYMLVPVYFSEHDHKELQRYRKIIIEMYEPTGDKGMVERRLKTIIIEANIKDWQLQVAKLI